MDEEAGHWRKILAIIDDKIIVSAWTDYTRARKIRWNLNDKRISKIKIR